MLKTLTALTALGISHFGLSAPLPPAVASGSLTRLLVRTPTRPSDLLHTLSALMPLPSLTHLLRHDVLDNDCDFELDGHSVLKWGAGMLPLMDMLGNHVARLHLDAAIVQTIGWPSCSACCR